MLSYDIEEHGIKNITSKLGIKISDYDQNFKIICSLIKQYVNVKNRPIHIKLWSVITDYDVRAH
jgi:hypothetical protein